jgi:hypothetical protein
MSKTLTSHIDKKNIFDIFIETLSDFFPETSSSSEKQATGPGL